MPSQTSASSGRFSTWFSRVVGAEVHAGEWQLMALFFANLFLLLAAYYILKVIREPLILLGGSAVQRSYARGLQAGLLVVLIPAYSVLANRIEPARLVKCTTAVFVASLGLFFVARRAGVGVGFAFFVWFGIFSTLSIAQFWSIANDVMTQSQGKRLFPLVAVGGTAGGILGAQFAARAFSHITPEGMMLVAAGVLVICMVLTHEVHARGIAHRYGPVGAPVEARDPRGGFSLVIGDQYLLLIGLSVTALNLITTTGDFLLAQMVSTKAHLLPEAQRARYIGAFYGDLQTWVTVLTTIAQIFFVSRVFKTVGIGGALLFMPLVVVVGYASFALAPLLAAVTAVKVGESTTDYSLENTIQHALFLPTSRDAKYKAKSAIDTVSKRLGDLGSTALVFVGTRSAFGVRTYAIANVVAGLVWIWLTIQLRRRQRAMIAGASGVAASIVPRVTGMCDLPALVSPRRRRVEVPGGALCAALVLSSLVLATPWARADEAKAPANDADAAARAAAENRAVGGRIRRPRVAWAADWPRFRLWEYFGTAGAYGLSWYVRSRDPPPDKSSWVGNNFFDDGIRSWLHADSKEWRAHAVVFSDRVALAGTLYPFVVDLPIVLFAHRQPGVMWQMLMMDLEANSVAGLLNNSLFHFAGRGRPDTASCAADPTYDPLCGSYINYASFPSGHVLTIATAAGLTCVHHRYLPIYGSDAADVSACVLLSTATFATALARMVAYRHFGSDVIAGGVIGFGSGYGLPWLLLTAPTA